MIRVSDPSQRSEPAIRVSDPSQRSESAIRAHDPSHWQRSESMIRVSDPSQQSEPAIRVSVPSQRSESAIRVTGSDLSQPHCELGHRYVAGARAVPGPSVQVSGFPSHLHARLSSESARAFACITVMVSSHTMVRSAMG
jgi:hypothetical protein